MLGLWTNKEPLYQYPARPIGFFGLESSDHLLDALDRSVRQDNVLLTRFKIMDLFLTINKKIAITAVVVDMISATSH